MLQKRKKPLPAIPASIEQHPDLQRHRQQVSDLEARCDATRAKIATLTEEQRQVSDALAEDKVAAVLAEDAGAAARVAAGSQRAAEIEQRLLRLREQSATEDEALRRVVAREPAITQALRDELRAEVDRVHRELIERLADQFAELIPINTQLLELRRQHGALISGEPFWLDALSPDARTPLPNHIPLWIKAARALGVTVNV